MADERPDLPSFSDFERMEQTHRFRVVLAFLVDAVEHDHGIQPILSCRTKMGISAAYYALGRESEV